MSIKVGVDCRLSGQAHAGIGRYVENLIMRLPSLATDIKWIYFFHDQGQIGGNPKLRKLLENQANIEVVFIPIRHYSIQEQISLPKIFDQAQLDLLHVPHFNVPLGYQGKLAITIHDLLWHHQRGLGVTTLQPWQYWLKYLAYRFVTQQAVKKAATIFVPAETIKKQLLSYYPFAGTKIKVTKEGTALINGPETQVRAKLNENQLLYVGSLYPHKNINLVLRALKKLPKMNLKIVGARNAFQQKVVKQIQKLGVESQVEFLGSVSDKQLTRLYRESLALIQPSFSEGFGLTGIEALSLGTPVLASSIDIFKEIYQDGVFYFDPYSPQSFINALKELQHANRGKVSKKGKEIANQYSWDKMAATTLEEYRKLLLPS